MVSWIVIVVCAAYLTYRVGLQVVRQKRSYRALPFPQRGFVTPTDRACASLAGAAIGDALGMPRESLPPAVARLRFGSQPKLSRGAVRFMRRRGTISDDTQLTIAVARAIAPGGIEPSRFHQELLSWLPMRIGEGRATVRAVRRIAQGEVAGDPTSQGNGAAMRIAPLVVAFRHDPSLLIEQVRVASLPTHQHPEAIAGAECVARVLLCCFAGEQPEVGAILPRTHSEAVADWERRLTRAAQLAAEENPGALRFIGTSGYVLESVVASVYLLLKFETDFRAALVELFHAGGDVDTIASIYGSYVGALAGLRPFEEDWLTDVQGLEALCSEAQRLEAISSARA